jgi:hypothetical protein
MANSRNTADKLIANKSGGGDLIGFVDLLGGKALFNNSFGCVGRFNYGSGFIGRLKNSSGFNTFFDVSGGGVYWGFNNLALMNSSRFDDFRVGDLGFNMVRRSITTTDSASSER